MNNPLPDLGHAMTVGNDPQNGPPLTVAENERLRQADHDATVIREYLFSATLATSMPVGEMSTAAAWRTFLDRLLKDAGNPSDPIEIMMIEQLVMAHFRVAQLNARAQDAQNVEAAKVFAAAAARMTGEFRRLALAVKQYRQPTKPRYFTVVRQQNLAKHQQVAYVAAESEPEAPLSLSDSEQGSKGLPDARQDVLSAESQACSGRSPEPAETRAVDAGGPGTAPAGRAAESAVALLDRPSNGRG